MKIKLLLFFVLLFGCLHGTEDDKQNIWLKTYYKTHAVKKFDKYWKRVMAGKILENPNSAQPTIGFASQVLHQNPQLLIGRLDNLKKIPLNQLKAAIEILWQSDTPDAREILKANGYPEYFSRPVPPIGSKPINEAGDLDFCWGWFFATGNTSALDPIISTLEFGRYAGAAEKYRASKQTEDDRDAAYKDALYQAAVWSLSANGKEDENVAHYLEEVFATPTTPNSRGMWLAVILSRLKPDKYKVEFSGEKKDEPGAMKITVLKSRPNDVSADRPRELDSLDATLAKVAKHAKSYPPHFASPTERQTIEAELKNAIATLVEALGRHPDNLQFLFLDGFANAMGHNLDFQGCADRCMASYERLLELQPENGKAEFYYGAFLASTAAHQKKSIVHLEKAIALGVTDAHFTLGFALLSIQNVPGALEHLREYSRLNPTEKRVKELIEHVEKSEFKIQRTGDKTLN